jgi:CHAT domain-containing protein
MFGIKYLRRFRMLMRFRHVINSTLAFQHGDRLDALRNYYVSLNTCRAAIHYGVRKLPTEFAPWFVSILEFMSSVVFEACNWQTSDFPTDPGRAHLNEVMGLTEDAFTLMDRYPGSLSGEEPADSLRRLRLIYAAARLLRYETWGDTDDLDQAAQQYSEIRSKTAPGHARWYDATMGLAQVHITAYALIPSIVSLDEAEHLLLEVIRSTDDPAVVAQAAERLGKAANHRYQLTGNDEHLQAAADWLRTALNGVNTTARPETAFVLANTLYLLGSVHSDIELLDEAIDMFGAVSASGDGPNSYLSVSREGQAVALGERGALRGDDEDLVAAAKILTDLLDAIRAIGAEDSAEWIRYAKHTATIVHRRYLLSEHPEDLALARDAYRAVLARDSVQPSEVLTCALRLGALAQNAGDEHEAAAMFERALSARRALVGVQLRRSHMIEHLDDDNLLAVRAAVAHARCGDADRAALAIENGRAFVLAEALERNRVNLDNLAAAGHAELRDRYVEANTRLAGLVATDASTSDLTRAWLALREVSEEIRAVPGWEDFRQPAQQTDISQAAADHPLVYLLPALDTGLAIIVDEDGFRTTWLRDMTRTEVSRRVATVHSAHRDWLAGQSRSGYEEAYQEVCRWLGHAVVGPLLPTLPETGHITVVACGALSSLPVHAALLPAGGQQYALDRLLITYAPSARSLNESVALAARVAADRLLAVIDPHVDAAAPLRAAPFEASAAAQHFDAGRTTCLPGAEATREAVITALSGASVLHAACHAVSDPADPMDSALILAGGVRLSVRDLTEQRVLSTHTGLKLAVLSACETAVVGATAPDEVIGLPAGLLEAGTAGVIATMTPVPDSSTALLMAYFYGRWRGRRTASRCRAPSSPAMAAHGHERGGAAPVSRGDRPRHRSRGRVPAHVNDRVIPQVW